LNQFATLKQNLSIERRTAVGLVDRFRYFVLAADPGLVQLKQAAKTVLAVVIGLEAFRYFEGQVALYAGMSAGFFDAVDGGQSAADAPDCNGGDGADHHDFCGVGKRTLRPALGQTSAAGDGRVHSVLCAPIYTGQGDVFNFRLHADAAGDCAAGWGAQCRPYDGGCFDWPVLRISGVFLRFARRIAAGVPACGAVVSLPARHAQENPGAAEDDLRAMHRAVALEEEEREHLGELASEHCGTVLGSQYEALQVLVLLNDIGHQQSANGAQEKAARFSRDYLAQVTESLETQSDLLNA